MRMLLAAAGFAVCVVPALAQGPELDLMTGVFATKPEACDALAQRGVEALDEDDILVMTVDGILGNEFHCDFVQVSPRRIGIPGYLVQAFCDEPGMIFPDVFAIGPYTETTLQLTGLSTIGIATSDPLEMHVCKDVARESLQ